LKAFIIRNDFTQPSGICRQLSLKTAPYNEARTPPHVSIRGICPCDPGI
jgi:hypothetical protein